MENKSHSTTDGPRKLVQNSRKKEEDGPRKLPLKLLEEITKSFAEEQILGSGAFGVVYKGVLDGEVIAVKKLRFMPGISDKQFENEFGHLSKLKHQNIVQLVGFCDETKKVLGMYEGQMVSAVEIHRALCLEFVPHGSLGKFLSEQCLIHDWHVRFKIIKGMCEGLNYLHGCSVMHLDLKPENILLDEKMVPKIADFGLSRLMGEVNTKITMSRLGTPGYMPPEFINNQIISTKYDIFSLGVILKKIVSGQMDYFSIAEMGNQECIEHVHDYWEKKLQEIPRYASLEVDCNQVRSCIEIAVDCMEQDRRKRPTIEDIVRKLDKLKRRINGDIVRKLNKLEVKENDLRSQIEQSTSDWPRKLPLKLLEEKTNSSRKLPLKILEQITNSFAKEQRLGSGEFGAVYKAVLGGEVIAVKKLHFMPGVTDKQFENEFEHLSKLKHQNIVQLVGFCDEAKKVLLPYQGQMIIAVETQRALCLEFVPHGCLGKFLSEQYLVHDWHVRFKMIKGICEGLKYLHGLSVMHLDLKPENILLDEKMVPKIADFGLSRLMGEENTKNTMSCLGTPEYMPPEFTKNQIISTEYDIFSLGVILKRILSGEMDYFSIAEMGNQECIKHVHNYWEKKLQKTPRYASLEVDCKQVRSCTMIAIECTKRNRRERPTIEHIVRKLNKLEVKEDDSRSQLEQMSMPPNVGGGDKKGGDNKIPVQIKGSGNNGSSKKDAAYAEMMMKQMAKPPNADGGDKKGGGNKIPVQIKGNSNSGSGKKDTAYAEMTPKQMGKPPNAGGGDKKGGDNEIPVQIEGSGNNDRGTKDTAYAEMMMMQMAMPRNAGGGDKKGVRRKLFP